MAWDFETDPEYQEKLDWANTFVREEVEPLDLLWPGLVFTPPSPKLRTIIDPLKQQVRDHGLWATHLEPELGGQGHGAVKLSLLNEILGRSSWAPVIFGCQAPDTGNAEIIAKFGNAEQKAKYLQPLLDGEVFSTFSMTEPEGGSDPTQFKCRAWQDGDEWVINGYKFFSSNAKYAEFLIVMVVTDENAPRGKNMSMFIVPADAPGLIIERNVGLGAEPIGEGSHALVHYDNVRLPATAMLGEPGQAFHIAQTRLGGGRIHHAMRTIAQCQKAIDMMCERALSRYTAGSLLSEKQFVQGYIADSYAELTQFRLFVLNTAWKIDKYNDYKKVRKDISAVKTIMPKVYGDIAGRALQVHGALGASNELPLGRMVHGAHVMALVDGATEVHKVGVAKAVLRDYDAVDDLWPSEHIPKKLAAAKIKYAAYLDDEENAK
jgi:acyl-CoA dehydrogenase